MPLLYSVLRCPSSSRPLPLVHFFSLYSISFLSGFRFLFLLFLFNPNLPFPCYAFPTVSPSLSPLTWSIPSRLAFSSCYPFTFTSPSIPLPLSSLSLLSSSSFFNFLFGLLLLSLHHLLSLRVSIFLFSPLSLSSFTFPSPSVSSSTLAFLSFLRFTCNPFLVSSFPSLVSCPFRSYPLPFHSPFLFYLSLHVIPFIHLPFSFLPLQLPPILNTPFYFPHQSVPWLTLSFHHSYSFSPTPFPVSTSCRLISLLSPPPLVSLNYFLLLDFFLFPFPRLGPFLAWQYLQLY